MSVVEVAGIGRAGAAIAVCRGDTNGGYEVFEGRAGGVRPARTASSPGPDNAGMSTINLNYLSSAMQQAAAQPARPQMRGQRGTDPWQELAVAAADSVRFMATASWTSSPISGQRDQIASLIRDLVIYNEKQGLPVGAQVAIASAAAIMGIEIGAAASKS
jgi:hypothetical protein